MFSGSCRRKSFIRNSREEKSRKNWIRTGTERNRTLWPFRSSDPLSASSDDSCIRDTYERTLREPYLDMKISYGLFLPVFCADYHWKPVIESCEELWPDGDCQNQLDNGCSSADFIKLSIIDIESDQTENICLESNIYPKVTLQCYSNLYGRILATAIKLNQEYWIVPIPCQCQVKYFYFDSCHPKHSF